jgi:hypothetical protein
LRTVKGLYGLDWRSCFMKFNDLVARCKDVGELLWGAPLREISAELVVDRGWGENSGQGLPAYISNRIFFDFFLLGFSERLRGAHRAGD